MRRAALTSFVLLALIVAVPSAQKADDRQRERDILEQLVNIDTSAGTNRTGDAARAMADRLVAAGLPQADVRVMTLLPGVDSLVARYRGRGTSAKPLLLMAHLDVVPAKRDDWSFDPFTFREQDGWYYGRGTSDNKAGAAMLVSNFIRFREEGFVPDRDLIIVLTGDEETAGDSIRTLVEQHRDLIDAEFALNTDGGGGELRDGHPVTFSVQSAEKVYLTFTLEVRNKGGHSSVPEPDNAIYQLAAGLSRLAAHQFPVHLNETSRAYFERSAAGQPKDVARDMLALARTGDADAAARLSKTPYYNSVMRTTCVATRLEAGHADNALPQLARATVNCRLLPDDPADQVEATLRDVLADPAIKISRVAEPKPSPPSALRPDLMQPIERLVKEMWPGAVVVPEMSTGATDGLFTRRAGIPTYGVSAVFDEIGDIRAHGRDERIGVEAYHRAAEFWYQLVKTLASGTQGSGASPDALSIAYPARSSSIASTDAARRAGR
jgi:acetylornithine deacetylase/succinyl-diaminopimelate desuccinylase-like protein